MTHKVRDMQHVHLASFKFKGANETQFNLKAGLQLKRTSLLLYKLIPYVIKEQKDTSLIKK